MTLGQNQDGRLETFLTGSDGNLWHNWQTAPNAVWHSALYGWANGNKNLGNPTSLIRVSFNSSRPSVRNNLDGRLEVFILGSNGHIYHIWQETPNATTAVNGLYWSQWDDLIGPNGVALLNARVDIGYNQNGRLEIFPIDAQGNLWHTWQRNSNGACIAGICGWSGWGNSFNNLGHLTGVPFSIIPLP